MKYFFVFVASFLATHIAFGQDLFAPKGARWVYDFTSENFVFPIPSDRPPTPYVVEHVREISYRKDTIIEGLVYKKLEGRELSQRKDKTEPIVLSKTFTQGLYRISNDTLLAYPNHLVFVFSAKRGDTITTRKQNSFYTDSKGDTIIHSSYEGIMIDSIGSKRVNDKNLTVWFTKIIQVEEPPFVDVYRCHSRRFTFIEHIGRIDGFLSSCGEVGSGGFYPPFYSLPHLRCYSDDVFDQINFDTNKCDFVLDSQDIKREEAKISIRILPSELRINFNDAIDKIIDVSIYDIQGRLLHYEKAPDSPIYSEYAVNMAYLPANQLYFLQIRYKMQGLASKTFKFFAP